MAKSKSPESPDPVDAPRLLDAAGNPIEAQDAGQAEGQEAEAPELPGIGPKIVRIEPNPTPPPPAIPGPSQTIVVATAVAPSTAIPPARVAKYRAEFDRMGKLDRTHEAFDHKRFYDLHFLVNGQEPPDQD